MYIPEFWCGVFMTLLCEVVAFVLTAISINKKENDCGRDTNDTN